MNERKNQTPLKMGDRVKFIEPSGYAGKYGVVNEVNEFGQPIVHTRAGDRITITSGTGSCWRRVALHRGPRRRRRR